MEVSLRSWILESITEVLEEETWRQLNVRPTYSMSDQPTDQPRKGKQDDEWRCEVKKIIYIRTIYKINLAGIITLFEYLFIIHHNHITTSYFDFDWYCSSYTKCCNLRLGIFGWKLIRTEIIPSRYLDI